MTDEQKPKYRTIQITQDAYDVLDFLSAKSRLSMCSIVSSWLEQVGKCVYPLEFASMINYMSAQNERGDKVISFFSPMICGQISSGTFDDKTTETLGDMLVDAAVSKLHENAPSPKKKVEKNGKS